MTSEELDRIAACLNACAGIEDPETAIRDAREALKSGLTAMRVWAEYWRRSPAYGNNQPKFHYVHQAGIEKIEAALAKLQPKEGA